MNVLVHLNVNVPDLETFLSVTVVMPHQIDFEPGNFYLQELELCVQLVPLFSGRFTFTFTSTFTSGFVLSILQRA